MSDTSPVADQQLTQASQVDPLPQYLRQLWRRRDYIVHVPLNELRVEQANTLLGNAWLIINPVLSVAIYALVFGVILDVNRGIDSYIPYLTIGVFSFLYTQRMITGGAKSVSTSLGLVRAMRFPRAVLPLSTAAASALRFLPNLLVMVVVVLAWGNLPDWRWLVAIPIFVLQTMFSVGGSLVVARMNHHYADIENTLPFVFRLLFYLSGVLYSVEAYVTDPDLIALFALNPMYDFLALWRWALLGVPLTDWVVVASLIYALVLPVAGFLYFRAGEAMYGRAS